jgi:hypothetical protein
LKSRLVLTPYQARSYDDISREKGGRCNCEPRVFIDGKWYLSKAGKAGCVDEIIPSYCQLAVNEFITASRVSLSRIHLSKTQRRYDIDC